MRTNQTEERINQLVGFAVAAVVLLALSAAIGAGNLFAVDSYLSEEFNVGAAWGAAIGVALASSPPILILKALGYLAGQNAEPLAEHEQVPQESQISEVE